MALAECLVDAFSDAFARTVKPKIRAKLEGLVVEEAAINVRHKAAVAAMRKEKDVAKRSKLETEVKKVETERRGLIEKKTKAETTLKKAEAKARALAKERSTEMRHSMERWVGQQRRNPNEVRTDDEMALAYVNEYFDERQIGAEAAVFNFERNKKLLVEHVNEAREMAEDSKNYTKERGPIATGAFKLIGIEIGTLNPMQGLLARIEGTPQRVKNRNHNVDAISSANNNIFMESIFIGGLLNHPDPHVQNLVRTIKGRNLLMSRAFGNKINKYLYSIADGQVQLKAKSTQEKMALAAAEAAYPAKHAAVQYINSRGGLIKFNDGHITIQRHDSNKIMSPKNLSPHNMSKRQLKIWGNGKKVDAEKMWRAMMWDRESWLRGEQGDGLMHLDSSVGWGAGEDEILEALDVMWSHVSGWQSGSGKLGRLGGKLGRGYERKIHFVNADAHNVYDEMYGGNGFFDNFNNDMASSAQRGAMMEIFGDDPETMINRIANSLIKGADGAAEGIAMKNSRNSPGFGHAVSIMRGDMYHTDANGMGRFSALTSQSARAIYAMAALGRAPIKGLFTDPFISAQASFDRGDLQGIGAFQLNVVKNMSRALRTFAVGSRIEEQKAYSALASATHTYMRDFTPFGQGGSQMEFGKVSEVSQWALGKQGMYRQNLAARNGAAVGIHGFMYRDRKLRWDQLNAKKRKWFEGTGFDEEKWDILRSMKVLSDTEGKMHVYGTDSFLGLDNSKVSGLVRKQYTDEQLADMTPKRFAAVHRLEKERLLQDFTAMVNDEVNKSVPTGDARSTRTVTQGQAPKSALGWLVRAAFQFLTHPIQLARRHVVPNLMDKNISLFHKGAITAHWTAWMMGMAAVYTAIFDLMSFTNPMDRWSDPDRAASEWGNLFIASGAAGIQADVLYGFTKFGGYGNSPLESRAGPTLMLLSDMADLAFKKTMDGKKGTASREMVKIGSKLIPFSNMPGLNEAIGMLFGYAVQDFFHEGYNDKREKNMKKYQGRERWIPRESPLFQ